VAARQIGFYVDTTRCINCKTCEVACKDFNDAAVGQRIRRVRTYEGGEFPRVFAYSLSMSCNHCEDPACLAACPTRAYTKRSSDGIVVHDPEKCIGCRYCAWVCPYGAPQYDAKAGSVRKCNLCVDELDAGRSPVCVTSCPLRALEVGDLSELSRRAAATMDILDLPPSSMTRPASRYKVRPEALK
jgi:anaerobic dimethyl sulfoxide reductase subunit B (iron-sulfur subunit)